MLTGFDLEVQFGLRWAEDVNFEARTVSGWRRKGRQRKLTHYDVPMSDDLAAVLRALPSRLKSPWVFPNASGTNRALGKLFVRRVFGPALRRAKIPDFRWKDLRHTFASRLRQRGVDIQDHRSATRSATSPRDPFSDCRRGWRESERNSWGSAQWAVLGSNQ